VQLGLIQDLAVVLAIGGVVAWLCQRVGVSIIVGYLAAGIVIGPYTPPFSLVTNLDNVHSLANLGLVFVMFYVGLNLSVPRLRRMGVTIPTATALTAFLLLLIARFVGGALGYSGTQSLFLAGVVMVSSSAIISSVLKELDSTRQPFGQQALGITVLEDVVAVAMLAVLGSIGAANGGGSVGMSVLRLVGFVIVVLVGGLLLVPRLLAGLRRSASTDIQTLCVAALLLGLAWLAATAGYSVALGAFLLGSMLGGTPYKARLEQAFEGLRDIFAGVFFISMGMLFDVRLALSAWPMVLVLSVFGLAGRAFAASSALTIMGQPTRLALQSASCLLPLGEFSFVIAQLGVASGVMPPAFYPATVGAALVTTLVSPALARNGGAIAGVAERHEPRMVLAWRALLARVATSFRERRKGTVIGRLLPGRILQLSIEVAIVASGLLLSRILYDQLALRLPEDHPWVTWFPAVYWATLALILLLPLVAIWRNLGVLAMIFAEAVNGRFQAPVVRALQAFGGLGVLLLCLLFLPQKALRPLVLLPVLAVLAGLAFLMRARLVRWYSQMHVEIRHRVTSEMKDPSRAPNLNGLGIRWNLLVHEHVLNDLSPAVGRTLRETALRKRFGVTLVGIDRHGLTLANPGGEVLLSPNDVLLLVGSEEQIAAAEAWLRMEERGPAQTFADLVTLELAGAESSPSVGKTLAELGVSGRFGVQLLAVEHRGQVVPVPSGDHRLERGDALLVLGTLAQHEVFSAWMNGGEVPLPPEQAPAPHEEPLAVASRVEDSADG